MFFFTWFLPSTLWPNMSWLITVSGILKCQTLTRTHSLCTGKQAGCVRIVPAELPPCCGDSEAVQCSELTVCWHYPLYQTPLPPGPGTVTRGSASPPCCQSAEKCSSPPCEYLQFHCLSISSTFISFPTQSLRCTVGFVTLVWCLCASAVCCDSCKSRVLFLLLCDKDMDYRWLMFFTSFLLPSMAFISISSIFWSKIFS